METKKRSFSPSFIGGSSLLAVFGVLCLCVFALLSISTVRANVKLGDLRAAAVEDYYAADLEAEEILARLRNGEKPQGVTESGGTYSYCVEINEKLSLAVSVKVSGSEYSILRWQEIPTADWKADDSLNVWDGESK